LSNPAKEVDLSEESPEFLGMLDQDPHEAVAQFNRFARELMKRRPPNHLRMLHKQADAVVGYFIEDCLAESFKVLRKYRPIGKTFAGWLFVTAEHWFCSFFRKWKNERKFIVDPPPKKREEFEWRPDPSPNPEQQFFQSEEEEMRVRVRAMRKRFQAGLALDDQIMLDGHYEDELPPRDIAELLRNAYTNKQVGDRLSHLRPMLIEFILEELRKTPSNLSDSRERRVL
jgi:DNA-directed RNA polymerase specialized sigma24 family protein